VIAKAGDVFVEAARRIASALGVSQTFIALTLIAFATSAPEFFTSLIAASLGNAGISYGNVVGSNIINITPVLALAAVFGVARIQNRGISDALFMTVMSGVLVLLSIDKAITPIDGLLLLGVFALFLGFAKKGERRTPKSARKAENLRKLVLLFILGTIGLFVGARLLIYGGAGIAQQTLVAAGLTPLEAEAAVGFTVIALGTSLPELATIVISIRKKLHELSIGTIIGSNIFNAGLIVGTASVACAAGGKTLQVDSQAIYFSNPMMLISMILLTVFMFRRKKIERWQGGVLLVFYAIYLAGMALFYSS